MPVKGLTFQTPRGFGYLYRLDIPWEPTIFVFRGYNVIASLIIHIFWAENPWFFSWIWGSKDVCIHSWLDLLKPVVRSFFWSAKTFQAQTVFLDVLVRCLEHVKHMFQNGGVIGEIYHGIESKNITLKVRGGSGKHCSTALVEFNQTICWRFAIQFRTSTTSSTKWGFNDDLP